VWKCYPKWYRYCSKYYTKSDRDNDKIHQPSNKSINPASQYYLVFDAEEDGDGKVYLWLQRPNESPDREATLMLVDSFQGM
jgi:hypothetical protein